MLLTKDSVFPYGKYKHILVKVVMNSEFGFDYCVWWNNTVKQFPFNDKLKQSLRTIQIKLGDIREKYRMQEHIRDKSYDDPQPIKKTNRGWDLPMDDKPLESYLYN